MNLFSKFFTVSGATLASRVLGFVREALIAATLGTGPVADAFYAAFRFPNLFRRLLGEGAFNSAFVPLFAKELEGGGKLAARDFAEQVLSVLLVVLLGLTAIAMIFMPFLVGTIIAPKFMEDPEKFELTVFLTRIMFPYLAAMSLVAMLSGVLNSFRHYFLAAIAPVLMNIGMVGAILAAISLGHDQRTTGIWLACGVIFSGLLQLGLLVYGVRKQGFSLSLRRPRLTPPVKRMLWLALPTAIAGGIVQINLLVGQIIASAQDGAIAVMNYADRLLQLPLGVIAIAIGVVLLPELARALKAGDMAAAKSLQNNSLEFGLALTVPAAIAFLVFADPLVALLFERGAFTRENTLLVADVLAAFAIGLPAFVLVKVFTPGYFAREDMKTPMWYSLANAIINIILALALFPVYGVIGLGIATSIAGWVNALMLAATLWRRDLFRPSATTLKRIVMLCLASAVMGLVLWTIHAWQRDVFMDANLIVRLAAIGITIAVSMVIYFGIAIASGGIARQHLTRLIRKKQPPLEAQD